MKYNRINSRKGMAKLTKTALQAVLFALTFSFFASCTDPNEDSLFVTPTTDEAEMSAIDVLERDASDFSMWIELLKYANYYNALKDGSAKATVFCPNNEAMTKFLSSQGVSSVRELSEEYAKNIVRVHIINNNMDITDSTLVGYARQGEANAERGTQIPDTTLMGSNLTVRYGYIETDVDDAQRNDDMVYVADSIYFNNQARLANFAGITCSNAVLFTMGDVILPLVETIMDKLDADRDTYGIFADAVRDCGYDSIASRVTTITYTLTGAVTTNHSFTCLAVPNSAYQAAGITDVASLKSYLSSHATGSDAELLNYIKYHFMPRSYTKDELLAYESEDPETDDETLIYDTQFTGQAFIINKENGKNLINKEMELVRTNIQARNGYIHRVSGVMPIYHPAPVRVAWDFLNSPDIISFVNSWGASAVGVSNIFSAPVDQTMRDVDLSEEHFDGSFGEISSFTYQLAETRARSNTYRRIGYKKDALGSDGKSQYGAYMDNFLVLNLGFGGWIQFTTPTIIAGKYKVVLHYCKDINHNNFITGGTLTRFDIDDKTSMVYLYKGMTRLPRYQTNEATIMGALEFEGSGNHTFKITMMDTEAKNNSNYHQSLDYLEFIPVN